MTVAPSSLVGVPFVDMASMTAPVRESVLEDWAAILDSGHFVNGPAVAEFETAFARFCAAGYAVGVASGLDALRLGLLAFALEPGAEVIVPANTFIATVEAVMQAGLRPVVVDASDTDYNIDVDQAAAAVTDRTSAILPVHLYGQMADMRRVADLARGRGLLVLEDACQAHGAVRDGIGPGAVGDAAAFSFYPGKNLGAFGDAGALTTHDGELAATVRALREHGQRAKYRHDLLGYTARLDTIQAVVLLRKLPLLAAWNEERRSAAAFYGEALSGVGDLVLPPVAPGSEPVWHLYVVRTEDPCRLAAFLGDRGIATGFHYPEPPHRSAALQSLGYRQGQFPVAEAQAAEVVSLPIFPGVSPGQLEAVVEGVCAFFAHGG